MDASSVHFLSAAKSSYVGPLYILCFLVCI